MQNLFDYLYAYLTHETYKILSSRTDYQEAAAGVRAAQEALLTTLSEEQRELFFCFLEASAYETALEQEHIVRETLSLPLALPQYATALPG